MKISIRSVIVTLICVCLLAGLAPKMLQNTGPAWLHRDSLAGRRNFYFAKRQWLADARTIAAGFRYLCQSLIPSSLNPADVVKIPHLLLLQNEVPTNFFGIAHPGPIVTNLQGA
jgi:hypothetical protein